MTNDDRNKLRAALLLLEQIDLSDEQGLYDKLPWQELEDAARPTKTVTSLMSGKPVTIDADTPLCCDPSSETYWSM